MSTTHFDIFELTSYTTGDLSEKKATAVKQHIADCVECKKVVDTLNVQKAAFLADMPFAPTSKKPANTIAFPSRPWKQITSVAAGLILLVTISIFQLSQPQEPMNRIKGSVNMHLFVQESSGTVLEREEQVYHPSERIQVTYSTPDKEYLMLFSIDIEGKLSRYEPTMGLTSSKIVTGTNMPLPHSIRLDDYLGPERFIMILSDKPLATSSVEKQVDSAFMEKGVHQFSLDMGDGVDVISTLIEKRAE